MARRSNEPRREELIGRFPGFLLGLCPEKIMRAISIALLVTAGTALGAQVFAQGAGGGSATGTSAGGSSSPSATTVPIQPTAPSAGETNPGVTPSAPGPSQANVPRGTSPSARQPGYASGHRQPRAEDIPQRDTTSEDAIKQLDKELSRKLSICRGC